MIYLAIAIIVGVAVWYFLFRRPPNQFPIEIGKKSLKQRAAILVSGAVWRVKWETDNPHSRAFFLNQRCFPMKYMNGFSTTCSI
jgi:hypothetical protein